MDNSWVFDLETKLLSLIKVKTESILKKKYPDIFYTNTDSPKDVVLISPRYMFTNCPE